MPAGDAQETERAELALLAGDIAPQAGAERQRGARPGNRGDHQENEPERPLEVPEAGDPLHASDVVDTACGEEVHERGHAVEVGGIEAKVGTVGLASGGRPGRPRRGIA